MDEALRKEARERSPCPEDWAAAEQHLRIRRSQPVIGSQIPGSAPLRGGLLQSSVPFPLPQAVMQASRFALAAFLGLAATSAIPAQVALRTAGREFTDAAGDILYTWSAPFHGTRRDWLAAAALGAGFVTLLPFDDDIDRWIIDHQGTELLRVTKPWRLSNRQGSRLAADSRLLPITGALVGIGLITNNRTIREVGYGCLTSSVVSTGLRSAVYAGVSRSRPVIAGGDQFDLEVPGGEWNVHSFFSGHAMNAFGCVTFLNARYQLGVGEPLLYAWAASVSLARMADRAHWASDIYLGSLAGVAVGRTLARRSKRRAELRMQPGAVGSPNDSWYDGLGASPSPRGISIYWQRSF